MSDTVEGKSKLVTALMDVDAAASIDLARTQTDYIGRMQNAMGAIEMHFDDNIDEDVLPIYRFQDLYGVLTELAGLATAQAAIVLEQHPEIETA